MDVVLCPCAVTLRQNDSTLRSPAENLTLLNRFLTVFLLTRLPTTTEDVNCDVVKRSRRWCWRIKTSCRTDVTRGAPERGLSDKLPVVLTRWTSLAIVDLDTPKRLATSFCEIPHSSIPKAGARFSLFRRGILIPLYFPISLWIPTWK